MFPEKERHRGSDRGEMTELGQAGTRPNLGRGTLADRALGRSEEPSSGVRGRSVTKETERRLSLIWRRGAIGACHLQVHGRVGTLSASTFW